MISRLVAPLLLGNLLFYTQAAQTVDFNRDIRPIFSDHCYACHGPDQKARKADLRLDVKQTVFSALKSGLLAVVPGDSAKSELVRRVTTDDSDDVMPPLKGGKPLSKKQIGLLDQWVAEGAEWQGHWAYTKPQRIEPPAVQDKSWPRNDIDRFVFNRLEQVDLKPSSEASKEKLARRATLDLTGLPPTVEEIDRFLADESEGSYETLVDRLLESKAYGERQAMFWLDLARYGETQGYHHDAHRDMWRWRDWVMNAFNDNMPFDQFTTEQLAGDLLPNPTPQQIIATGFHRNEMTTSEGGALPEEYAVKYVVGRIDTTARVWMGTSLACAECHDHKYDPIKQTDYYRFFAFFNTIPENGLDRESNPMPRLELKTPDHEMRLAQLDAEVAALESAQRRLIQETNLTYTADQQRWENEHRERNIDNWLPLLPVQFSSENGADLVARADNSITVSGANPAQDTYRVKVQTPNDGISGLRLEALPDSSQVHGASGRSENGEFILTRVEVSARSANPERAKVQVQAIERGEWWRIGSFGGATSTNLFDENFGPEPKPDLSASYYDTRLKWVKVAYLEDGKDYGASLSNGAMYFYHTFEAPVRGLAQLKMGGSAGVKVWLNGSLIHSKKANKNGNPDLVPMPISEGGNSLLIKVSASGGDGSSFTLDPMFLPVLEQSVKIAAVGADANRGGYEAGGTLDDLIETGWSIDVNGDNAKAPHFAWFRFSESSGFSEGTELDVRLIFSAPVPHNTLAHFRLAMTRSNDLNSFLSLPNNIRSLLVVPSSDRTSQTALELQRYYREQFVEEAKNLTKILSAKQSERKTFQETIPVSMVMREMEMPRKTHLLIRGEYNNPGEVVAPGVPEAIFPWAENLPANRLGLAKWLLDPDHPLTARVLVNQFWQQHFGTGLVKTSEDFGAQGESPSHPELLDWLATELIGSGWNMKQMHRLIVTSATYRQEAAGTAQKLEKDPGNRLLAHFPRQRLEAEAVRDLAISVSGLLNSKVGGPSVFPYQPPGLWEQVAFEGTRKWEQSLGVENYRRGLYVYWRRSVPYASFVTFDAPSRETCTVKRPRTNTPLQALVLMNDPVYVEAARTFGSRIIQQGGNTLDEKVEFAFRTCLGRNPTETEQVRIRAAFQEELAHFLERRADANQLVHVGATPPPNDVDPIELAAWTMISQVLLNLDETITKG